MVSLKVDNQVVEVPEGATLLEAARKLGIRIPTLCFLEERRARTSCMVCLVRLEGEERLVPACGVQAKDGMEVASESPEVKAARKASLELLLSEHGGDCLGPCHTLCPAWMDIPRMIRQIMEGDLEGAIRTVKADIALPAVLHRICPAPCEKGCRRAAHDEAVSIRNLVRWVADADLASSAPYRPECKTDRSKQAAIIGAGPAGLAAAFHLRIEGIRCVVFDDHEQAGGMLRYGVPEDLLPRDVLDQEISLIEAMGVSFRLGTRVGESVSMEALRKEFDAMLIATGGIPAGCENFLSLECGPEGIKADRDSFETHLPGVFAAGDVIRPARLAVRALALGKRAAHSMTRFLTGQEKRGPARPYTTRLGKLAPGELEPFLAGASDAGRIEPAGKAVTGYSHDEAKREAKRCLHCDCAKLEGCRLRKHAMACGARPGRFKGERRVCRIIRDHPSVIYEPGKCIACGLCVLITEDAGEALGLAFVGRGFDVKVAVPFDRTLEEGLARTAAECVEACPTGALVSAKR